jgi:hypothetical protein
MLKATLPYSLSSTSPSERDKAGRLNLSFSSSRNSGSSFTSRTTSVSRTAYLNLRNSRRLPTARPSAAVLMVSGIDTLEKAPGWLAPPGIAETRAQARRRQKESQVGTSLLTENAMIWAETTVPIPQEHRVARVGYAYNAPHGVLDRTMARPSEVRSEILWGRTAPQAQSSSKGSKRAIFLSVLSNKHAWTTTPGYARKPTDDVDVVCGRASKLQWRDGVLAVTRTRRKGLQQLDPALADDRYKLLLGNSEYVVAGPVRVIVADPDVERSRLRFRCDRRVATTRGIILTGKLGLAGIKDGDEWVKRR